MVFLRRFDYRELYRVEKAIREECGELGYSLNDPGKKGDQAVEIAAAATGTERAAS
jgi:hypothetical protein